MRTCYLLRPFSVPIAMNLLRDLGAALLTPGPRSTILSLLFWKKACYTDRTRFLGHLCLAGFRSHQSHGNLAAWLRRPSLLESTVSDLADVRCKRLAARRHPNSKGKPT